MVSLVLWGRAARPERLAPVLRGGAACLAPCCFRKAFGEITEVIRHELESRNFAELTSCLREARGLDKKNEQGQLQA